VVWGGAGFCGFLNRRIPLFAWSPDVARSLVLTHPRPRSTPPPDPSSPRRGIHSFPCCLVPLSLSVRFFFFPRPHPRTSPGFFAEPPAYSRLGVPYLLTFATKIAGDDSLATAHRMCQSSFLFSQERRKLPCLFFTILPHSRTDIFLLLLRGPADFPQSASIFFFMRARPLPSKRHPKVPPLSFSPVTSSACPLKPTFLRFLPEFGGFHRRHRLPLRES